MTIVTHEALQFGLGHLAAATAERGHRLCLLTRDRSAYRYELERDAGRRIDVVDVETLDAGKVLDRLAGIPDLAGLISPTDAWSLHALEVAEKLGVPHQNAESVALVRNKARFRNLLNDRGLTRCRAEIVDPRSAARAELKARLAYPVVVKDIAGTSSRSAWLVRRPGELDAALDAAKEVPLLGGGLTVESYFCGPLFSIEALTWRNETRIFGVSSRVMSGEPQFREEGLSFPVALPTAAMEELEAWLVRVLDAVGYSDGFSHTEFIMTTTGPEVVEVNPRLAGALVGEAICQTFDINVYGAFVDMALGRRPTLMDHDLRPRRGIAQFLMYPTRAGVVEAIDGMGALADHPGGPSLYPVLFPGDEVRNLTDQRGCVAILLASGDTAELALSNVLSAVGKLHIRVRESQADHVRRIAEGVPA